MNKGENKGGKMNNRKKKIEEKRKKIMILPVSKFNSINSTSSRTNVEIFRLSQNPKQSDKDWNDPDQNVHNNKPTNIKINRMIKFTLWTDISDEEEKN